MTGAQGCILLIAGPDDSEATLVQDALLRRAAFVARIDTADFPGQMRIVATPALSHPGWLTVDDQEIDLGAVSAVYRRSPGVFGLSDGMSDPERRFALMEATQGVGGVFANLRCTWVNHPARVADAAYKPRQLAVARECGFTVPATLVTNDGDAARKFIASVNGRVVYKPMSPGVVVEESRVKVLNATIITSAHINDTSVARTAHAFQQFIEKRYDARVTVIGDAVFGVAIEAETPESFIDWRADYDALRYSRVEVPAEVRGPIRSYMHRFGLSFAALDFSVDRSGKWWFLEANPNGLWAWLEERTEIPVADAIARYLTKDVTKEGGA